MAFLKRKQLKKNGKVHTYWALVESIRTARGPRHRTVAYLGEMKPSARAGWAKVGRILSHQPATTGSLFDGTEDGIPETVEVRVRGVRVERTRDFGDVYLGWLLWRTLKFDQLLEGLLPAGRAQIPWPVVACLLTLARFCEPSSELHIAESWYRKTALDDLLGVPVDAVNKDRLYRAHDQILPHKAAIEGHLKERYETLFDATYDLLLYDVTSVYFEGQAEGNEQAQRGYSRDQRPDCKQVCVGLVVTRVGLPVAYEIYDGNRTDVTTVEDMVDAVEAKHGRVGRVWVMDRGMVSEDNLAYLRERDGRYLVGTPKAELRKHEQALLDAGWTEVQHGVEVKLCPGPDGEEAFLLCRSRDRREKEKAMHARFETRIEEGLERLARRLNRAKKPDRVQVERQIGRLLGRNSRAAGYFDIRVDEVQRKGRPGLRVRWKRRKAWQEWASLSEGCYLLRTNLVDWKPEDLWKTYIQLTQVEAAFRVNKSEMPWRPVWHHHRDRVQAHLLFSFLAYAMWKTLEQWMTHSGLGSAPRPLIEEIARLKATDVLLPTSAGRELRIRCVTQPDKGLQILLSRLGLEIPARLGQPRWAHTEPRM
jgi:transposase